MCLIATFIKTPGCSSRVHYLLLAMAQKQVILSVTINKAELNAMLAEDLLDPYLYSGATLKIICLLLVLQLPLSTLLIV